MLSGCAAAATPAPQPTPAPEAAKQEVVQSNREKEMVLLFQSLIKMDKRDQLTISSKQAESLLPLIKRNSSEGELGLADQKIITDLLTGAQKQYVDDFLEETRLRKEQFKQIKEQTGITDEERERMIREFLTKRAQERDGQLPPPRRNPAEGPSPGQPGSQGGQGGQGGKNIEQQLIDLLEAKLRKEPGK
jgi:phage terminase small subunit